MTPRRLTALLRAHGPSLDHWPAAEREAARRLLVASAAARRTYIDALEADAALAGATLDDEVAGPLCAQLAWQVGRTPQAAPPPPHPAATPLGLPALAACALIGLAAGWYSAAPGIRAGGLGAGPLPPAYASVDLTPFTGSGE